MDRVETRELAYFLAVADELHFSRAAERLGIAQPALSKTIRQLERRLGVELFERSSRAVSLTPAGQVLVREGRHALDAVTAAAQRTRRAGATEPSLVLTMKPGGDAGLLPAILAAYDEDPQAVPVRVTFGFDRPSLLRDGRADVALLYRPVDDLTGLDCEPLLTDPPMAVLPAGHRLAGRSEISMAELAGEKLHRQSDEPKMAAISELMQLIALGEKVAVLPRSLTVPLRDDLITVPVTDAPPVTLVLAWPAHSTSPAIAGLVRAAQQAVARQTGLEWTTESVVPASSKL